jgi:hypothetical protein
MMVLENLHQLVASDDRIFQMIFDVFRNPIKIHGPSLRQVTAYSKEGDVSLPTSAEDEYPAKTGYPVPSRHQGHGCLCSALRVLLIRMAFTELQPGFSWGYAAFACHKIPALSRRKYICPGNAIPIESEWKTMTLPVYFAKHFQKGTNHGS